MEASRYTFTLIHDDGTKVSVEGNKESVTDVLEDFKSFMLACGYHHENISDINNFGVDDVPYFESMEENDLRWRAGETEL